MTLSKIDQKSVTYTPQLALDLFSSIASIPWAMLLRSSPTHHPNARYDILVAQPIATVVSEGQQTTIELMQSAHQLGQCWCSDADPFQLLHDLQTQLLPETPASNIPFVGGVLGYFAYDLGRRIEHLPQQAAHDIALPEMAVGVYEWAFIVDHVTQQAYWVGQHLEEAMTWMQTHQQAQQASPFQCTSDWQSNLTQADYCERLQAIHDYLNAGDCYQINLTQRFQASYEGSEWDAFLRLEAANQAPFSAFIRLETGAILSVSPERFLHMCDRQIETKPIKGTRPRHPDPHQDRQFAEALQHAEKDQSENLMIVDLLRNDIGRVAKPGSVNVPALFAIESFPAVHHLVSTIQAELDHPYHAYDLLRACFPGGSITGAPKVRAMEIIESLEPHRRSAYCGSIGYISRHGQMDTSITIRTVIATQNQLYVWGGGGIVADSEAHSEYQETFDKLSQILPVLAQS